MAQNGQRFRPFAEYLANNGIAAALISYRGLPDHTCRETVADTKTAVRFLRKISNDFGIDSDRIGAMGRSAGATLAALLAVSAGIEELEKGGHAEFSSRIKAAVGIAGVYDFVARFTREEQTSIQPGLDKKLRTNSEWIGSAFSLTDEHWLRVSAINHVDPMDTPMLLIHSMDDPTVPWMQSLHMYETMKKAGIASEIELSETGGHGGPATAKESMITFFKKVLAAPGASPNTNEPCR